MSKINVYCGECGEKTRITATLMSIAVGKDFTCKHCGKLQEADACDW